MIRARALLQDACFDYAQAHMPRMLQTRGWTSPELMDLVSCADYLSAHQGYFLTSQETDILGDRLLWCPAAISCAVSYRVHVGTGLIVDLLSLATTLVRLLRGSNNSTYLNMSRLLAETAEAADELELQKLSLLYETEDLLRNTNDRLPTRGEIEARMRSRDNTERVECGRRLKNCRIMPL